MDELIKAISFEETIKGSKFLSELLPCKTQAEARDLLKQQKEKYSDSTHVVHAFITGNGAEVMGMSDDGEPSGTAGRPALDVLKGRGCTNVILTITRWFGGTLLGTGGLVKAYSNGAKQVILAADENKLFVPLIEKKYFSFSTDYSLLKVIKRNLENYEIFDLNEAYGTEVTISGKIRSDQFNKLADFIREISRSKITVSSTKS